MPFICVFEDIYFDESNFSLQWIFNFEMMTEVDFSPQWNLLFLSFFFFIFDAWNSSCALAQCCLVEYNASQHVSFQIF